MSSHHARHRHRARAFPEPDLIRDFKTYERFERVILVHGAATSWISLVTRLPNAERVQSAQAAARLARISGIATLRRAPLSKERTGWSACARPALLFRGLSPNATMPGR
ncbi:MAG: hypothetical protein ACLPTZ_23315 [Beijerinckiaceae bacterium]